MQNPDGRARFVSSNLQGRAATPDPTPYIGRARRAVAGRPLEPLPVRHEPRLVRAVAARDARPHQDRPRVLAAGHRRSAREGRRQHLLLRAAGRSAQSAHHQEPDRRRASCSAAPTRARFDERGWAYFIREVYDSFYPGYGESWPIFQGSIGMTYEQASARGLAFARSDGDHADLSRRRHAPLQRRDRHRRSPRRSNREQLLRDFLEYRRSAIAEGEKGPIREYVLVPGQRSVARRRAGAQSRDAGHRGAPRRGGVQARRADASRPAPTSCRTRSRPGA